MLGSWYFTRIGHANSDRLLGSSTTIVVTMSVEHIIKVTILLARINHNIVTWIQILLQHQGHSKSIWVSSWLHHIRQKWWSLCGTNTFTCHLIGCQLLQGHGLKYLGNSINATFVKMGSEINSISYSSAISFTICVRVTLVQTFVEVSLF